MHPVKSGIGPTNEFPSSHLHRSQKQMVKSKETSAFMDVEWEKRQLDNQEKSCMQNGTYNSTKPLNFARSVGMFPDKFCLDNELTRCQRKIE